MPMLPGAFKVFINVGLISATLLVLTGTTNPVQAGQPQDALSAERLNAAPPGQAALAQFESLSAGYRNTCGIKSDGSLACWGDNTYLQSNPPAGTSVQVSVGDMHTCALMSGGSLVCWGDNSYGQSTPTAGTF